MLQVASSSFKAAYKDLTGLEWNKDYEKVMEMTLELTAIQQEIKGRNHAGTSDRGKKCEEDRQWVIKA